MDKKKRLIQLTEDSYNKAVQNNKIISFYGDSVVV